MRGILFLLLLSVAIPCAAQQNGYYVTLQNDTIPANIKVEKGVFNPNSFYSLFKNVTVASSGAEAKVFKPGDIRSFYVETHLGNYHFYSKPLKDGTLRFLEVVTLTSKANLYGYRYSKVNSGGGIEEYTIERADGTLTFFENELYVKAKKKFREFFKDEPAILAHLEKYFKQPGYEHRDLNRFFKKIEQDFPAN